jgi:hypothetical protein
VISEYSTVSAAQELAAEIGLIADAPDELTVQTWILSGPDGSPVLILSPAWSGDPAQGDAAIDALAPLGSPVLTQIRPMTYGEMLGLYDAYVVSGRHYAIRTRTVTAYSADVVATLVEAGATRTSPSSGISIHHFHGAASHVPIEATAFGIRKNHFVVEIVAAWEPDDVDSARHLVWTQAVSEALAPSALPGGYANLLGPHAYDQIAHAYGPNAARLRAAKARFDPAEMFSAIPLPGIAEE